MAGHIPGPELDHVATGIGHVSSTPAAMTVPRVVVVEHRMSMTSQPLNHGVICLGR
jgi:hypothetical protein